MNPREGFVKSAVKAFAPSSPAVWRRAAPAQLRIAVRSGRLTLR